MTTDPAHDAWITQLRRVAADPLTAVKRSRATRLGAVLWNLEYRIGRWRYLDTPQNADRLSGVLTRYAPNGRILDLGCGTATNLRFVPDTVRHYHGVDISEAAIQKARHQRRPNQTFETADISTYGTSEKWDGVLLREVLYYLPEGTIPAVLERALDALDSGGVVIVQIWNTAKYARVVDAVRASSGHIVDEIEDGPAGRTFVLQRPS